nr:FISUMP domain-containing protein [Saprospiraceae bacterium]
VLGGEEAQPASNNNLGATTPNVKGICPVGWHLPSVSEFKNLDVATASTELKFPSTLLWEGATFKPIASGFNAVPAGCYFPWPDLPQNQYNFRGKRGFYWSSNYQYQTPFEASTQGGRSIYIYELRTGVGQESVLQTNGLLQGQILNKYEIKSIEEVGYSCRCVKN